LQILITNGGCINTSATPQSNTSELPTTADSKKKHQHTVVLPVEQAVTMTAAKEM